MNPCFSGDRIVIIKGDDTNFNGQTFLNLVLNTTVLDLSTFKATFSLGGITKKFDDISSGEIHINYTAEETESMPAGKQDGVLRLTDNSGRSATIESLIPFDIQWLVHGDAIATKPFEMTINIEQGGENILNIDVKSYLMKIEVGKVKTLPAGSDAYVTNTGTANEAIFNFGIPKGADGKDGIDGQDATINGVSTLTLTASDGLTLEQEGSVANISGATLSGQISDINDLIPEQASSSNQLADKGFVNSTTQTLSANFRGNWATWEVVPTNAEDYPLDYAQSRTPTVNDYLVVQDASDYTGETLEGTWRFKYSGEWSVNGKNGWHPEYQVNETPLTAVQLAALNSGATQDNIAQITTNKNAIGTLSSLTTTDKSSLVGAVNELNSSKQATITGGASTITSANLTANRALISNAQGKVAVSPVTNTELGYLSGATSSIQTQLNGKASTSLDNLSDAGQMIIDSQNGTISNCILDIPQDINLTLLSGTLTLASGSVLTLANGTQLTTSSNLTLTTANPGNLKLMICAKADGSVLYDRPVSNCTSGAGATAVSGFALDTTALTVGYYLGSGTLAQYCTLPIAVVTVTNGVITAIDKTFNGFGYIGSSMFVLPGVKGLIPNGFNSDGTLKSDDFSCSSLLMVEMLSGYTTCWYQKRFQQVNRRIYIGEFESVLDLPYTTQSNTLAYIKNENAMYLSGGSNVWQKTVGFYCPLVKCVLNGTSVTQFDVRQPVRLATTEMLDKVQDQVDTNTADITNKQDKSNIQALSATDSITLANNMIYNGGTQTSLTITTPSGTVDNTFICEIDFTSGSTSTVINDDNNITWQGNDIVNGKFYPDINTRYTVMIYYNGINFVALERGV